MVLLNLQGFYPVTKFTDIFLLRRFKPSIAAGLNHRQMMKIDAGYLHFTSVSVVHFTPDGNQGLVPGAGLKLLLKISAI